ncbi:MAG: ribosome-associated translation inhibitor RaiA [Micavibrio aeruginosavorus]|uniref:Ribosome hibernation promoting factor n=1 Tax=Micavibrio aeruginosavorus TaxID=349221 RepID=A0A2W5N7U0_9BACT|nr:MAG: ribosome-associated translation inhibitor RaiA [Micavibrio aeruginosavorus]
MQLTVQGKQMDLGDALRTHVSDKLEDINTKYFNRAIDATVTFAPEGQAFTKTHISIRVGKDIMVISDATENDPYVSFDQAADKVAKQLRRYKRKLRDHHERVESLTAEHFTPALDYTLSADGHDEEVQDHLVIAEIATNILTMSPSEAAMRLELSNNPALMFRNAGHKGLNMVYRRPDGNIGWVDPDGKTTTVKKS